MKYKIRTAVPTDEGKIRELFLEMLRTIYHTDDVKGYEDLKASKHETIEKYYREALKKFAKENTAESIQQINET